MTVVRFLEPAEAELEETIDYLDQQSSGLGDRFRREVEASVARIRDHPLIGAPLTRRAHKLRVRRFQHNIIYGIVDESIVIIAIAHHKRRPQYWRLRLKDLR
jgi:plasmid stabilization system protein ParE